MARTALTAEVHQENRARGSDRRASARTSSDYGTCGFVSGRHRCALKKLLSFRATESIGADPEQELAGFRFWHFLFYKSYFFVPAKMGSFGTRGMIVLIRDEIVDTLGGDGHTSSQKFTGDLRQSIVARHRQLSWISNGLAIGHPVRQTGVTRSVVLNPVYCFSYRIGC